MYLTVLHFFRYVAIKFLFTVCTENDADLQFAAMKCYSALMFSDDKQEEPEETSTHSAL